MAYSSRSRAPGSALFRRLAAVLLTLLAAAAWFGCASGDSSKGSSADSDDRGGLERAPLSPENQKLARGCLSAVLVSGHPRVTLVETIESVFTGAGFTLAGKAGDGLIFERPAPRNLRVAYGSWSGDQAVVRLRVDIYQEGTLQFFVRSRSYVARAAGTGVEDEQSLARRHVREYEGLLHEVATRLD